MYGSGNNNYYTTVSEIQNGWSLDIGHNLSFENVQPFSRQEQTQ